MKKFLFFLPFIFVQVHCHAQSKVDSLLIVLDHSLKNKEFYSNQKNKTIDSLKKIQSTAHSNSTFLELNDLIADNYRYYISDSAFHYINQNKKISEKAGDKYWEKKSLIQYSSMLSSVGIFNESLKILETINLSELNADLRLSYFKAYEEFYVHLLDFIDDSHFRKQYEIELANYRDSVVKLIPKNTAEYFFWKFKTNFMKGNFSEAQKSLLQSLDLTDTNSHLFAGANFCMSLFYDENKNIQERDQKMQYMIIAAISDIRSATKENFALISLSNALYEAGDIKRAYEYTHHALEDANFYNARYRYLQIGKMLPIIEKAYQAKSDKQKKDLLIAIVIISLLLVGLLVTVFFIRKQMLSLSKARRILGKMNTQLKDTNNSLKKVNQELSESNQIKESYIGHFLNLCSIYIGKIEDFQKITNKKGILEKKFSIGSTAPNIPHDMMEVELREFYKNFDSAFLAIFPDFVDEFNELMPKDSKIFPKFNEKLTTELRIFALIRLGISDSNKIASLLRYSLTTIYTYRSRIKNKSLFPTDFEENIKDIGTSKVTFPA